MDLRSKEIQERLLKDRIVFIGTALDDFIANQIIAQLLFLQMESRRDPIHAYINSPGGYVNSSMAIFDTFKSLSPPVRTVCVGQASGTALLLMAAGSKGGRTALPHSRFMFTKFQPGANPDEKALAELKSLTEHIEGLFRDATGQPVQRIREMMKREAHLSAKEALEFGLIDRIDSTR